LSGRARPALAAAASQPSAPTAAAGHQERLLRQSPRRERLEHFLNGAACLRNDADSRGSQRGFQGPGDRAADEHIRTKVHQAPDPARKAGLLQGNFLAPGLPAFDELRDDQVLGDVKYRRNAPAPG